jgi:hypothetical protein
MLLFYSTVLLAVIAANVVVALLVATIVGKDRWQQRDSRSPAQRERNRPSWAS